MKTPKGMKVLEHWQHKIWFHQSGLLAPIQKAFLLLAAFSWSGVILKWSGVIQ